MGGAEEVEGSDGGVVEASEWVVGRREEVPEGDGRVV